MKLDLQEFITERAEHLAFVYLTRREDLVVERIHSADDYGIDMLVKILRDGSSTEIFGVQVKGQDKAIKEVKDLSLVSNFTEIESRFERPFPIYVFLFTMDDDRGYYSLLQHPSSELNLSPLHSAQQKQWYLLDEKGMSQIVDEVNAWYNAKRHSVA